MSLGRRASQKSNTTLAPLDSFRYAGLTPSSNHHHRFASAFAGLGRLIPGRIGAELVMPTPTAAPSPQLNAHALLIQIAKYPTRPLPDVSDAADLADVLRDPGLCGYPPDQVRMLHDHQATRAAILDEIRRLVAAADEDATVLLYFSGHGGQVGGATYLIPIDTQAGATSTTAIAADELARELAKLRARKVLLIFDCCHAGGLEAKHGALVEDWRPGLPDAVQTALVGGRGWALFAASDANEYSYVHGGDRNGLFTKHFLDGMRGARASDDGVIRVFDLFEYLQPRVVQDQPTQHPVFKCALRDNFAIARYRGGAIGTVARTDDGFLYHALLAYAKADAAFVRTTLIPQLRSAGLRVASANDIVDPEVDRVVGFDRGLEQARRTLVIVSKAFLHRATDNDRYADHLVLQRKHADIVAGRYSLIPIYLDDPDTIADRPGWLASLAGVQLAGADADAEAQMSRLLAALARPLARR